MRKTLSVAICVIVSLVLVALATRYIHPHWIFATLHSLQLHLAVGCIAAMLVALLIYRDILVYALLMASLLIAGHAVYMSRDIAVATTQADTGAPSFRLLSFNILSNNFDNRDAITKAILGSGADVVTIMEALPLLDRLTELSGTYPYRIGCGIMIDGCDQLMLSKVPLENAVVRTLSDIFEDRFILAQVTLAGQTINVGGIHTTKPYFDSFHTLELMRAALALNDRQGPLVLSGDFNASSLAPNMRSFLNWTDLRTAGYEPATWPIRAGMFGVAIDHVYVRSPLKIKSLTRLPKPLGSNHNGLLAEISATGP
jgi:endonuclease/exonuclease/phosphatase (EEP) superfamily protein YafD